MDTITRNALKKTASHLRMFARNGRWGTCTDCPRDSEENAFPEFCVNTERYDHHLTMQSLAEQWATHSDNDKLRRGGKPSPPTPCSTRSHHNRGLVEVWWGGAGPHWEPCPECNTETPAALRNTEKQLVGDHNAECAERKCKKCGVQTTKVFCHECGASVLYVASARNHDSSQAR